MERAVKRQNVMISDPLLIGKIAERGAISVAGREMIWLYLDLIEGRITETELRTADEVLVRRRRWETEQTSRTKECGGEEDCG